MLYTDMGKFTKGRKQCSTKGLVLLNNILQGVVPQKLCEGPVLSEQLLVGAHLRHATLHHHHYVIHLRQEADAVRHQDACLEYNNNTNLCYYPRTKM